MAKEVIKKDGSREPFDTEKIRKSIRAAADHTDLPEEKKNEIVEKVAFNVIQMTDEKEEIATSEIREKILSELDNLEPVVAEAWRKYEEGKGAEEGGEERAEEGAAGGEGEEGGEGEVQTEESGEEKVE